MPAWVAHGRAAAAPRLLRWRCRRLAAACPVRLVGDIRHATAVVHKVFGQENKPGAPVTSSQGARDTNVRPPNRAWEERDISPGASVCPTRRRARARYVPHITEAVPANQPQRPKARPGGTRRPRGARAPNPYLRWWSSTGRYGSKYCSAGTTRVQYVRQTTTTVPVCYVRTPKAAMYH